MDSEKLPPHSDEAERASLGCILMGSSNAKAMLAKLCKTDFYDLRHREVFTACHCLSAEGKVPDLLLVQQWLKDKGRLEESGGMAYVFQLPDATPSPANFEHYFGILKEKARRREALNLSVRLSELAYNEAIDPRALLHDARSLFDQVLRNDTEQRQWFRFLSPGECQNYEPPQGWVLAGDNHIARGAVTLIAGPPGVGKSRVAHGLAVAGATGQPWQGLPVHRKFKTAILQNEDGLHRLKTEFNEIGSHGLDDFIRISEPPPFGMAFDCLEFRTSLSDWLANWQPDLVIFDPWNSAARDDGQRDYLGLFKALKEVFPKGDAAPALVIVAHTRKPKGDDRKTGRGLLHDVAGSHVLGSVPRCVFIMQHASDDEQDDCIVWTCCKNNDGELGARTAWHRRNGLFIPCTDFDWQTYDSPTKDSSGAISKEHLDRLFDQGKRRLARRTAVAELEETTGCKKTACYSALDLRGRFKDHLSEDENGLLSWDP